MVHFAIGYKRVLVIAGILVVLVLIFSPDLHRGPTILVERPLATVLSSLEHTLGTALLRMKGVWTGYVALVGLHEENQHLRAELERVTRERETLQEAAEENTRLHALLEFRPSPPLISSAARVIGRDPSRWYQSIVIDRGRNDGPVPDLGVYVPSGVVGTVVKVFPSTSVVLLISDRRSAVPVVVQRTREQGIVEGTVGNRLRLKYLPPSSDIRTGDLILTSGLTDLFPKGLTVGTVSRVERRDADLYPDVEVIPAADLSHLEEVLVIEHPPSR